MVEPLIEALCRSDADLAEMRVVCDWIQYKSNFRDTVMVRPVIAADAPVPSSVEGYELAVDLRRCARPETDVAAEVTAALADGGARDRVWLEPWVPGSASCVWRFNALYWQALAVWEKVTGKEYEQSLPGGESDARNAGAAREVILDLFSVWDELTSRRALPEELYVFTTATGQYRCGFYGPGKYDGSVVNWVNGRCCSWWRAGAASTCGSRRSARGPRPTSKR